MFLRNCWYVAAWSHELGAGQPIPRRIIDEALVLYRDAAGKVVVLQDRCCHRHAPLSRGQMQGEALRCMYHGLLFSPQGECIEIPGQAVIPPQARVRAYPAVERHSWIWVWMGDAAKADPQLIPPSVGLDDPAWSLGCGQIDYEAGCCSAAPPIRAARRMRLPRPLRPASRSPGPSAARPSRPSRLRVRAIFSPGACPLLRVPRRWRPE